MLRFKKLLQSTPRHVNLINPLLKGEKKLLPLIPLNSPCQWTSNRFLDMPQMGNKEAYEKARARLNSKDEMNRGCFADMSEMKQHGGKFPTFEVNYSDGSTLKLPINDASVSNSDIPKATLLCLSFRASSQAMVDSWSLPFLKTFGHSSDVRLYEVSFRYSWLLSRSWIKKLLLKIMRKSKPSETNDILQKQIVYSFGDHYYFRKELKILNLLTGYVFLLDKEGRIRWQGTGLAAQDELLSLLSCTSLLLEES